MNLICNAHSTCNISTCYHKHLHLGALFHCNSLHNCPWVDYIKLVQCEPFIKVKAKDVINGRIK